MSTSFSFIGKLESEGWYLPHGTTEITLEGDGMLSMSERASERDRDRDRERLKEILTEP